MTHRNLFMLLLGLTIPILLADGLLMANDDEGEAGSSAAAANSSLSLDAAARQDSLFIVINGEFNVLKPIFEKSCFDCHSRFTKYPWYHKIPGVKQLLDRDVKEGREQLDLSSGFPFSGKGTLLEILGDMKEEVGEGDMPLLIYRIMHWETGLSGARRDSVVNWLDSARVLVVRFYDQEGIPYEVKKAED